MRPDQAPQQANVFHLSDYKPYPFKLHSVELDFVLEAEATVVSSLLKLEMIEPTDVLELDGEELEVIVIGIDDSALNEDSGDFKYENGTLTIFNPPADGIFELRTKVRINPQANKRLEGLYRSNNTFCTQCEAEGFRRITFYPDRPDVMTIFSVRIEGPKDSLPLLLSNGNLVNTEELANGRHVAGWHDPHPKPAYLFALVAGDLGVLEDSFTTMSGREVALKIYVEHGKEPQAGYAMDALKRSMKWDEEVYGREYDLDIFMIVAVSDFNMGAMENKGLNIFNDRLVLASPETATDANYAAIEAVIAHEYFHNWTGNRITCRDWFQLCLKEGLTVYRDSEFSADMRSRAVKRIEDVLLLRATQLPEDMGPLAHAVRPESYAEINNFYTATVYEKGAEIVRMLHSLFGDSKYFKALNLYFERHDGEATTVEAWLKCFEDVTGEDLSQFALWYSQAGSPLLQVSESFTQDGMYEVTLEQSIPDTLGQTNKKPMRMPIAFGLLASKGDELESGTLDFSAASQTFSFGPFAQKPILSILRNYSAPLRVEFAQPVSERMILAAHDTDPFNRWQALQDAGLAACAQAVINGHPEQLEVPEGLMGALANILVDSELDPAFRAQCLGMPSQASVAQYLGSDINPDAIHAACEALASTLAQSLSVELAQIFHAMQSDETYAPTGEQAGRRSLANICLDYLLRADQGQWESIALNQFDQASNMTDRLMAMVSLINHGSASASKTALDKFEAMFCDQPLVMDHWLAAQARKADPETLDRVKQLTQHKSFSFDTPNRVYSLIRTFAAANLSQFARKDGAGFDFVADCVIRLNKDNPQVAARILTAFRSWRMLEKTRAAKAQNALQKIADIDDISPDVADIVGRTLS